MFHNFIESRCGKIADNSSTFWDCARCYLTVKVAPAGRELGMNPQGQDNPSFLLLSSCGMKSEHQRMRRMRVCTHRTEVGVLYDVLGDSAVRGRQGHDEKQGVSGLLTN